MEPYPLPTKKKRNHLERTVEQKRHKTREDAYTQVKEYVDRKIIEASLSALTVNKIISSRFSERPYLIEMRQGAEEQDNRCHSLTYSWEWTNSCTLVHTCACKTHRQFNVTHYHIVYPYHNVSIKSTKNGF